MWDSSPAPASTTDSTPRAASFLATSGTSATRFSPWADWLGTPSFIEGARENSEGGERSSGGGVQLEPPEVLRLAGDPGQESLAVGAVVGPGEHQQLGSHERRDAGCLLAQRVREAGEGHHLAGALALGQALPVRAQLALVEVILADAVVEDRPHIGSGGALEQLRGDDRQVEVARIRPVCERRALEDPGHGSGVAAKRTFTRTASPLEPEGHRGLPPLPPACANGGIS